MIQIYQNQNEEDINIQNSNQNDGQNNEIGEERRREQIIDRQGNHNIRINLHRIEEDD